MAVTRRLASLDAITKLLTNPTWSVKKAFYEDPSQHSTGGTSEGGQEEITAEKLRHLLKLSALPLPANADAESAMLDRLRRQLRFVHAIRDVDTTGVEPLIAIRDETKHEIDERTIGLDSPPIQRALARETRTGRRGRIREKSKDELALLDSVRQSSEARTDQLYNAPCVLEQAAGRVNGYVAVNTKLA